MRKISVFLTACALSAFGLLGAAPAAHASCHDIGTGRCIETVLCEFVANHVPNANCIQ